jgi:hypothetical protein
VTVRRTRAWGAMAVCAWLAACATVPAPDPPLTLEEQYEPESAVVPSPLVEYPPIEPVEPPVIAAPAPTPAPAPSEPPRTYTATPSPPPEVVALAPPSVAAITPAPQLIEDVELVALLADLQRYGGMSADDIKKELASMTQVLTRQRTDANRVRLAVLYTISRANPQDDQRALQLLDNVSKSNPGSPSVKQLAFVLQTQIAGRQRAVREEQQKADAALQKLEALRQMERSLIRDRARSGGGGGSSGGGSGGGGSGGGGSGGGG